MKTIIQNLSTGLEELSKSPLQFPNISTAVLVSEMLTCLRLSPSDLDMVAEAQGIKLLSLKNLVAKHYKESDHAKWKTIFDCETDSEFSTAQNQPDQHSLTGRLVQLAQLHQLLLSVLDTTPIAASPLDLKAGSMRDLYRWARMCASLFSPAQEEDQAPQPATSAPEAG